MGRMFEVKKIRRRKHFFSAQDDESFTLLRAQILAAQARTSLQSFECRCRSSESSRWRGTIANTRGRALPKSRCCARRQFRAIFGIANFPAKLGNSIAKFVAPLPIFFTSRVLAVFCERRYFFWNHGFGLSFEIENAVNPLPAIQPSLCRCRVHLILI